MVREGLQQGERLFLGVITVLPWINFSPPISLPPPSCFPPLQVLWSECCNSIWVKAGSGAEGAGRGLSVPPPLTTRLSQLLPLPLCY